MVCISYRPRATVGVARSEPLRTGSESLRTAPSWLRAGSEPAPPQSRIARAGFGPIRRLPLRTVVVQSSAVNDALCAAAGETATVRICNRSAKREGGGKGGREGEREGEWEREEEREREGERERATSDDRKERSQFRGRRREENR